MVPEYRLGIGQTSPGAAVAAQSVSDAELENPVTTVVAPAVG